MASIALRFLLGQGMASHFGVRDQAGKNVVSAMLIGTDLTPVGVVLARHVALQRVTPEPPPAGGTGGTGGTGTGDTGTGGTGTGGTGTGGTGTGGTGTGATGTGATGKSKP